MPNAAQFYRQLKQQIREALDTIEAGTAELESINEALDCVRQLPPSTEGLNEWTQKLESEKQRLRAWAMRWKQNGMTPRTLNQALDRGDCSAAEASLKN